MPIDPKHQSWKPGMPWEKAIDDIAYVKSLAAEMGGPERIERQHSGGRYTIRERIDKMVDPGASWKPARWWARPSSTSTATCASSCPAPT